MIKVMTINDYEKLFALWEKTPNMGLKKKTIWQEEGLQTLLSNTLWNWQKIIHAKL